MRWSAHGAPFPFRYRGAVRGAVHGAVTNRTIQKPAFLVQFVVRFVNCTKPPSNRIKPHQTAPFSRVRA
jgi:hypothetical protein